MKKKKHDEHIIGEIDLGDHASIYSAAGKIWTMTGQLSFSSVAAMRASTLTTEIGRHLHTSSKTGKVRVSIMEKTEGNELILTYTGNDGLPDNLLSDVKRLCDHLEIPEPVYSKHSIEARIDVASHSFDLTPGLIRTAKDNIERHVLIEQLYTALLEKHTQARKHLYELMERERQLLFSQKQLRKMTSELALTEEHERKRLATALHDSVVQSMSATTFKTRVLDDMLEDGEAKTMLASIRRELSEELQLLRSLTFELSPPILYELGLSAAIEWLGERMQKHGINFVFETREEPINMHPPAKIMAFQCVREMLTNVRKHANASIVTLNQEINNNRLIITVADNGKGFDPASIVSASKKNSSFGLLSIRERLKQVGGGMNIKSRMNKGTRIELSLPFMSADDAAWLKHSDNATQEAVAQ